MGQATKSTKRLPPWIRGRIHPPESRGAVARILDELALNTVCQSAGCPNLGECWRRGAATFMILGDRCTRNCAFCAIGSGRPLPPDPGEPHRVAEAAARMKLGYVVVTSVDRDDLPDKGAEPWAATVRAVRQRLPGAGIEALTPDFMGRRELIHQVIDAGPAVYNHNLETCERLTPLIRSANRYTRSLEVLETAAELGRGRLAVKSGIMAGLGETDSELEQSIRHIREAGAQILTIGQYLCPSKAHRPVDRYVEPEQFELWAEFARGLGFKAVASAPLVRSSYRAEELAREILGSTLSREKTPSANEMI